MRVSTSAEVKGEGQAGSLVGVRQVIRHGGRSSSSVDFVASVPEAKERGCVAMEEVRQPSAPAKDDAPPHVVAWPAWPTWQPWAKSGDGPEQAGQEMGLRLCIARKTGHVDLAIATVDVRIDVVRYRKGVQVNPCTGLKILGTE